MNLILVAWRAFPAAPETRALKRLRVQGMVSLMVTAMLVAWNHLLWIIHPFAVLLVPVAAVHAIVVTGRYWVTKNRADERYQASICVRDEVTVIAGDTEL